MSGWELACYPGVEVLGVCVVEIRPLALLTGLAVLRITDR